MNNLILKSAPAVYLFTVIHSNGFVTAAPIAPAARPATKLTLFSYFSNSSLPNLTLKCFIIVS